MPDEKIDPRKKARYLYWAGWRVCRIAETLNVKRQTVFAWKYRDKWDDASSIERVDGTLEGRLILLIAKEEKEGKDYKEIDLLGRQLERTARVKKYLAGGNENDLNPKHANKNKVRHRTPERNTFTEEDVQKIEAAFHASLFDYQRLWFTAGETARIRNILKSRQIGATWYFAREALLDALLTGRNQIFLSASKAQTHVFKQYIIQFAHEVCGVELSGNPIMLANGAMLYFLGTNVRTAQSYHGNPVMRICTGHLKIRPMELYAQQLGFEHWDVAIGFRADEPQRVARLSIPRNEPYDRIAPLARAGVTVTDVTVFWKAQPFDLTLSNYNGKAMHGNCDLCFLKGMRQVYSLIRECPERAVWWMNLEQQMGHQIRNDRPSYADMLRMAEAQGEMFGFDEDEAIMDCFCTD